MVTTALSLIAPRTLKLDWSIKWRRTVTSTCSTSRQSGVPSIRSITKPSVFMRTIGKILEENLTSTNINATRYAITGSQEHSSPSISKGARTKRAVPTLMDGRSKSTTHYFTRHSLVRKKEGKSNALGESSALSTIQARIGGRVKSPSNKETGLTSNMTRYLRCLWTWVMLTSYRS